MKVSLIFASSINGVIGVDNKLPWNLKLDMLHFKALTTNKVVIMGRKTFESIGSKPLPNRINAVISTTLEKNKYENVYVFNSLDECLEYFKSITNNQAVFGEVFIIGGKRLIEEGIAIADTIYNTAIKEILPVSENSVQLDIRVRHLEDHVVELTTNNNRSKFEVKSYIQIGEVLNPKDKDKQSSQYTLEHLVRVV